MNLHTPMCCHLERFKIPITKRLFVLIHVESRGSCFTEFQILFTTPQWQCNNERSLVHKLVKITF